MCKLARTPRYKKKQKPNFLKKEITFSNINEKKNCGARKLIRTPWSWEKMYKWRKKEKKCISGNKKREEKWIRILVVGRISCHRYPIFKKKKQKENFPDSNFPKLGF